MFVPDSDLFTDFDENLREAFSQETRSSWKASCVRIEVSSTLISANYTFVNERLARHYGIPDIHGNRFRRVTLPADRRAGTPRPREHLDGDVVSQPDVARSTRQMAA